MTKYIKLAENKAATHLKVEVYYNLGGYNCFTYKPEERGYYLSVSPVTRENRGGCTMESYAAFSGIKQCVHVVNRKSAKAETIAAEKAAQIENTLISWVLEKNGLELETEAAQ